jgi:ATP-binding protein involved in chromosome partitioning
MSKIIIPVASGKGGVGKSTVSANIALALARDGARVGLMDADVYGPSIPTILGAAEEKPLIHNNRIQPVERYGIKIISMGFFVPAQEAVIWRGPMLHKMVQDFLGTVEWGDLDYLIVDLPPGTGDIQLSLCQSIAVTGALIVSTPQDVAWNVAQKAIIMFDKLNAPVLGIVENMSHHICGGCGQREEIFGSGGARKAAERLGIPYLGDVPLLTSVRRTADAGDPIVHSDAGDPASKAFFKITENLKKQAALSLSETQKKPIPAKIGPPGQKEIRVEWNDGHASIYSSRELRLACPCAGCVHEVTGERILDPASILADIRPLAINPIGRYALQIHWSDRHNTGIYSYDKLRALG